MRLAPIVRVEKENFDELENKLLEQENEIGTYLEDIKDKRGSYPATWPPEVEEVEILGKSNPKYAHGQLST